VLHVLSLYSSDCPASESHLLPVAVVVVVVLYMQCRAEQAIVVSVVLLLCALLILVANYRIALERYRNVTLLSHRQCALRFAIGCTL
jgi:hypothetical protein